MNTDNAPFVVGQRVVALKTSKNNLGDGPDKDSRYKVIDIFKCKCGLWKVDVGIESKVQCVSECASCGNGVRTKSVYCNARIFAPIQEQYADIREIIANLHPQTNEGPDKVMKPQTVNN